MGYIYKITNTINNKVYIGQTTQTVETRWKQHQRSSLTKKYALYYAMRKYGIDNFKIETLEQCDNKELDEKEIEWIAFYNSYRDGYNMTLGGSGKSNYDYEAIYQMWQEGKDVFEIHEKVGCRRERIYEILLSYNVKQEDIDKYRRKRERKNILQYSQNGILINEYYTLEDASQKINSYIGNIERACRQGGTAKGFFWKYATNEKDITDIIQDYYERKSKLNTKSVCQIDFEGNIIKIWPSLTSASEYFGCSLQNIKRSISHPLENACGFLWEFEENKENIPQRVRDYLNRPGVKAISLEVKQYSMTGEYINTFPSMKKASEETGIERTALQKAVRNKYTSGGYVWVLTGDEELVPEIIANHISRYDYKKKVVKQYDKEGNYIQSFPSAKDAAKALGDENKFRSIARTCQGYQQTCLGYKWSY